MKNKNLSKAKQNKNDEFYTRYEDIETELKHYPVEYFKDKVIYCPCDVGVEGLDIPKSNFIKYFEHNKEIFGYKKLIHTSLQEGFDYRSAYCQKLFKEADVVVTNPPFSLFRDFFTLMIGLDKKFLIIGHKGAVCYNEIFPYIKQDTVSLGFTVPNDFSQPTADIPKSMKGLTRWFTNLETSKGHEELILVAKYSEKAYKKYDHFDAIEVSKTKDIPCDYMGIMGVPITFLDKYNSNQFELIDCTDGRYAITDAMGLNEYIRKNHFRICSIEEKPCYARILIRRKQQEVQ